MDEAEIRKKFYEALESLKQVHTREGLEEATRTLNKWRSRLIAISPTFREEIAERQRINEFKKPEINYMDRRGRVLKKHHFEPWMMDPNLRKIDDLIREKREPLIQFLGGKLACPECGDRNRGNKRNSIPWCIKCDVPLEFIKLGRGKNGRGNS